MDDHVKKYRFLATLVAATGLLWLANLSYPHIYVEKGFYTFLALTITHLIFKIGLENTVLRKIRESKTRYSFRKAISIVYFIVILVVVVRIWVEYTQTLLVSYGLIAAGITIALQDFFKNFVGGIMIFTTGTYRVGDRVEINSKFGDVIDIGIFYTTLLELKEWVEAEQPTGRISMVSRTKGQQVANEL